MEHGAGPNDRVDLIARVFKLKLDALLDDVMKKGVFGRVIGHMHVIELQKRGLPHAHILVILANEDKPQGPADYDRMVCAEIPDPATHPALYEVVTGNMMHGPCGGAKPGAVCMKNGECSKKYPRPFQEETMDSRNGYPVYRRRENGRTFTKEGIVLDNSHVIPYNPWLSEKYACHINVEVCTSVAAVKYLYKYVYKGVDRAEVNLIPVGGDDAPAEPRVIDEIRSFREGRYLSAAEAAWRNFIFPMHSRVPAVVRLALHLPDEQTVYIREGDVDGALRRGKTSLTEWLRYNHERKIEYERDLQTNPDAVAPECLSVLYPDFADKHTWDKNKNEWKPRGGYNKPPVGRMYSASNGERLYLRMLLLNVPGATSWEYLRTTRHGTPEAQEWPTFKEACRARGLLQDDAEWERCLTEAASFASAMSLRGLYATLLAYNDVNNPKALWEKFQNEFVDDFLHTTQGRDPAREVDQEIIDRGLRDVERQLVLMGKTLEEFELPIPAPLAHGLEPNMLVEERGRYPVARERLKMQELEPQMNAAQRAIYDDVMAAVRGTYAGGCPYAGGNAFFVDGLGGAGKTFLYNCLLCTVRADERIALPVASSGIAALLLAGGRTAHSRFKIPVSGLSDTSTCKVPL